LRGSRAQRVIKNGANQLSVYSTGKEYSKEQWKRLVLQFLQQGLLNRDPQHGSLRLTKKGWAVLESKEQFQGIPVNSASQIAEAPNTYDATTKELNEYNHKLFEQLRMQRETVAAADKVPAYIIFQDKALREMASQFPQTVESFKQIHGVGTARVKKYADVFLPIIRTYCQEHGLMDENR
jgi:ATP-dependent DNA helicase RecQ